MIALITRRDTGSNDARSSPDLGIETPEIETTEEASRCELGGGLKTEKNEPCRNELLQVQDLYAQERARTEKKTANGSDASGPGANDRSTGIEISSMRSIGGSKEVNVDVALMMAEEDYSQSSADGSVGGGADLSSTAFHDPRRHWTRWATY